MFINLSNHPSQGWEERQIKAASRYGEIVDWPFPPIPAEEGEEYIRRIVKEEGPGYKKEVSFRFARFREYL